MTMSNTAKKKESKTPRMICSSLVNSPSTAERRGEEVTASHRTMEVIHSKKNIETSKEISMNTCSFDMIGVLRVCVLTIDIRGSELEPVKYGAVQSQFNIIKHVDTMILSCCAGECALHLHIDGVWLQWPIAVNVSVVLLSTVIVLTDHVRFCRSGI